MLVTVPRREAIERTSVDLDVSRLTLIRRSGAGCGCIVAAKVLITSAYPCSQHIKHVECHDPEIKMREPDMLSKKTGLARSNIGS